MSSSMTTLFKRVSARVAPKIASSALNARSQLNLSPFKMTAAAFSTNNLCEGTARRPTGDRVYTWVDEEAEKLIAKAYGRHVQGQPSRLPVRDITVDELRNLGTPIHYTPQNALDMLAYGTMRFLRVFTHMFFQKKYDHHAVVLETVAAVPGIVASAFRHLRSLRKMERDHGWIPPLQEEAENERMHLLIWMKYCNPTLLERGVVMLAQLAYLTFYTGLYAVSPQSAHRMVGYLEEEAHIAYTAFLEAVENGELRNGPAPDIARAYYNLPDDATIRDVILHVRADECMHRDFNHMLADKVRRGESASAPYYMGMGSSEQGAGAPKEAKAPDAVNGSK